MHAGERAGVWVVKLYAFTVHKVRVSDLEAPQDVRAPQNDI